MSHFSDEQELWFLNNQWQKSDIGWQKTNESGCHYIITPKIISDRTWFLYDFECPGINSPDEVDYPTKTFTSASALFRYIEKDESKE